MNYRLEVPGWAEFIPAREECRVLTCGENRWSTFVRQRSCDAGDLGECGKGSMRSQPDLSQDLALIQRIRPAGV